MWFGFGNCGMVYMVCCGGGCCWCCGGESFIVVMYDKVGLLVFDELCDCGMNEFVNMLV